MKALEIAQRLAHKLPVTAGQIQARWQIPPMCKNCDEEEFKQIGGSEHTSGFCRHRYACVKCGYDFFVAQNECRNVSKMFPRHPV